jgi:hypothetical protein
VSERRFFYLHPPFSSTNPPTKSKLTITTSFSTADQTQGKSEYVEGLTLPEAATLLNVDVRDGKLTAAIFETARQIKERIYGNRCV